MGREDLIHLLRVWCSELNLGSILKFIYWSCSRNHMLCQRSNLGHQSARQTCQLFSLSLSLSTLSYNWKNINNGWCSGSTPGYCSGISSGNTLWTSALSMEKHTHQTFKLLTHPFDVISMWINSIILE